MAKGATLKGKNFCDLACADSKTTIHPETNIGQVKLSSESPNTLADWITGPNSTYILGENLHSWLTSNYMVDAATRNAVGGIKLGNSNAPASNFNTEGNYITNSSHTITTYPLRKDSNNRTGIDVYWAATPTFVGATSEDDGTRGFVPAPSHSNTENFLCSNGGWVELRPSYKYILEFQTGKLFNDVQDVTDHVVDVIKDVIKKEAGRNLSNHSVEIAVNFIGNLTYEEEQSVVTGQVAVMQDILDSIQNAVNEFCNTIATTFDLKLTFNFSVNIDVDTYSSPYHFTIGVIPLIDYNQREHYNLSIQGTNLTYNSSGPSVTFEIDNETLYTLTFDYSITDVTYEVGRKSYNTAIYKSSQKLFHTESN